ncbi:TPA: sulfite exporter TauE/SafE family protein [Escherichia coli]
MDFFTLFSPDGVMLETNVVCIVIALMFLYTFVGICAGFGGGLTTMPLVTLMLPVKMATPLSVIVGTATALYATWLSRKETDWRSAMVLIIFSFLGIPVGLYALSYLPDHFMKVGLGGFLILYSFYSMFIPRLPIYDRNWIAAPIGAVAGALGAAFSTNGPPMVIYGMSLVGQYVHKRISVKVFRVMVFLLLIASGSMLIKGALGIPAAAALLPPFTLLVILQLAFGKKVAAIRRAEESK